MKGVTRGTPDLSNAQLSRPERLVVALLALAFAPALLSLMGVWFRVDYYSHGLLVPFAAFWIAHRIGQGHRPFAGQREGRGGVAIGLALAILLVGLGAGSVPLQGLALVGAVAGGVLYFFRREGLVALAFPLGFLLFMVPLPEAWLTPVIVELQLVVSRAAGTVLNVVGFEVAQEGNVLILPGQVSLFVEEACSGITSIVTLTPLAIILALLTERRTGQRLLIVAAVVPLAMFGNLARVVGTVVAAQVYGAERATQGVLHDSAGVLAFALSCSLLMGVGVALRGRGSLEPGS